MGGNYLKELIVIRLCFQVAAVLDGFLESGGFGCEGHDRESAGLILQCFWGVIGKTGDIALAG